MPSGRIWKVFAISAKCVVAEARIVRVKNARRQRRSARRRTVQPRHTVRRTSRKVNGDVGVSVANAELHHRLTERGWMECCRADGRIMYDWPQSSPNDDHEITYLIVDLRGEPPYRVSVVNGDRLSAVR